MSRKNFWLTSLVLIIVTAVTLLVITPTQKERVSSDKLAQKAAWELSIDDIIGCFYTGLDDVLVLRSIHPNGLKGIEKATGIKKWEYLFEAKEGNKIIEVAPNILCIFDIGKNRVLRLNPLTGKELWSYDQGNKKYEDANLIWADEQQLAWVKVIDNSIKYLNNVVLLDVETGALDAKYYYRYSKEDYKSALLWDQNAKGYTQVLEYGSFLDANTSALGKVWVNHSTQEIYLPSIDQLILQNNEEPILVSIQKGYGLDNLEIISFKDLSSFQTATRYDLKELDQLVKLKETVIVINDLYTINLGENNRLIKVFGAYGNALQPKLKGAQNTSKLYHVHNNRTIAYNKYSDDNKSFDVYNNGLEQKEVYSVAFLKGREIAAVAIDDRYAYIYVYDNTLYAFPLDKNGALQLNLD